MILKETGFEEVDVAISVRNYEDPNLKCGYKWGREEDQKYSGIKCHRVSWVIGDWWVSVQCQSGLGRLTGSGLRDWLEISHSPKQSISGAKKVPSCCCCAYSLSHGRFFMTSWTVACQAPPSMGFFRQEHWSGFPFPSPGDRPGPGIETTVPVSPALQADSLPSEPSEKPLF